MQKMFYIIVSLIADYVIRGKNGYIETENILQNYANIIM